MFSTQADNCIPFVHIFDFMSLFVAELEKPKIGISGKGLNLFGSFFNSTKRQNFELKQSQKHLQKTNKKLNDAENNDFGLRSDRKHCGKRRK